MSMGRVGLQPPLPPDAYVRARNHELPFPLQEPRVRLFSRARHALFNGSQALGMDPGDVILVPAYHHGAEVQAYNDARLDCRFYGMTDRMAPDPGELERLLTPRVRALHLTHILGFPQDARYWREWCDGHGLFLIEDAAQAILARNRDVPVGALADLSVFSLYKAFGVPDGAAQWLRSGSSEIQSAHAPGLRSLLKRTAAYVAMRVPVPSATYHRIRERRMRLVDPATEFAMGDPSVGPSRLTEYLMPRVVGVDAARTRLSNYRMLLSTLRAHVPEPFQIPSEGASPYGFPVVTGHRDLLATHLARHGVSSINFWKNPHPSLDVTRFAHERSLRSTVLLLPVHQELRPRDLEVIALSVGEWFGSINSRVRPPRS